VARRAPLALLFAVACGGGTSDDGGGTTGTPQPTTSAMDDAPDDGSDVPMASSGEPPAGSSGSGSDDGAPGDSTGPIGAACTFNADCRDGEYCWFDDHSCGVTARQGACTAPPDDCGDDARPVCACNGELYANECAAAAAGMDVAFVGKCEVPNGAFACGYSFCILDEEYCAEIGGTQPSFQCIALPPVCQPPDCSCITDCCECDNATCCAEFCSNVDGALTYTCPG